MITNENEKGRSMKKWVVLIISCAIAIGVALLIRHYTQGNNNDEAELFVVQEPYDPDAPGNQLIEAVRVGNQERVVQLLEAGANPDWVYENSGPPLVTAILAEKIEMIVPLLDYGADTSVQDANGKTAYEHSLDWYGNDPMLNELLGPKKEVV